MIETTLTKLGFKRMNEIVKLQLTIDGEFMLQDVDGHAELICQSIDILKQGKGQPAPLTPVTINGNGKAFIKGIAAIVFPSPVEGERYQSVSPRFGMTQDDIVAKCRELGAKIVKGETLNADELAFIAAK